MKRTLLIVRLASMVLAGFGLYFLVSYHTDIYWKPSYNLFSQLRLNKVNNPEVYMTVNDQGRTGNKIYELFSLCGTAWSRGHTPAIQPSMANALSRLFDMSLVNIVDIENTTLIWNDFNETSAMKYDARIEKVSIAHNWFLHGYFQSWKYFHKYGDLLRANFKFNENLLRTAELFFQINGLTTQKGRGSLNIGIHVRRGDTISQRAIDKGYVNSPPSYFRRAMAYFRWKYSKMILNFIVASDDMKWCKHNINDTNVYFSTGQSPEEDIVLLTRCDHMIISVGSFGRIIGWYVGGDVIRISTYPRPGSRYYNKTIISDVFPEQWIPLE